MIKNRGHFSSFISIINKCVRKTNQQIEVFDCQKKWSFKTIFRSSNPKEAVQYAKAITGPFKNLNVVPKDGYMIKIPLSKPVSITNQWLHTTIDEVLILLH